MRSWATATLTDHFAVAMTALGPFGPRPRLAVGVSGGADSTALAILADSWARREGGSVIALIIDHGLRPASADEAASTAVRLGCAGIETETILLGLDAGPALQERARAARHAALAGAALRAGAVHLLLGHHAGDQVELLAMRAARGPRGAAGMAGFAARDDVTLLRPLLATDPAELRAMLHNSGVAWIEDPSNTNTRFERVRFREALRTRDGIVGMPETGPDAAFLVVTQKAAVRFLARHVEIRPEGYALIRAEALPEDALAALLRVIGGSAYPPARNRVARLAASLQPATLGGVRLLKAGRLGPGWLLVREVAHCASGIPATVGAVWDGRFRADAVPAGATRFGSLGSHAARIAGARQLPAAILRGLPTFFRDDTVLAVPHLCIGPDCIVTFTAQGPVAGAPFSPIPGSIPNASHPCV